MSAFTKIAGFVAGVSAVAVVSVAVAQGVPPNPHISNPALGAGQQAKTKLRDGRIVYTPMGETGVLAPDDGVLQSYASIQREPVVAAAEPAPAPAAAEPAATPAPAEPVAQAPVTQPDTNTASSMGAPAAEPQKVAKADRN